jgi:DNA-binding ferritin-like protein
MASSTAHLELRGLGKQKMSALAEKARRLGVTPARYLRQLVEADLAIEQEARATSFAELMKPVRADFTKSGTTEQELDHLVDMARSRHHERTPGKRKKR